MASHHHINHLVPKDTAGTTSRGTDASHLGRLNDLDEFKVADGYPDIRGWDVRTTDGQTVGKVGDLIVDTAAMRVRYLDVDVERSVAQAVGDAVTPGDQHRHTLLPIGNVQLDEQGDHVMVDGYTLDQIGGLPRYNGQTISRDYESTLRDAHRGRTGVAGAVAGAAGAGARAVAGAAHEAKDAVTGETGEHYAHTDYDDQRLYASRRGPQGAPASGRQGSPEGAQRLTLAEEQLSVGKRQVSGGAVELRKTVDVEHVQEQVQLSHEEVTVERRPIAPGQTTSGGEVGPDEIRIPVMEERIVMQKVMVPREEIIVRKKQVTDQQTVEADLRKERLVVDDAAVRASGPLGTSSSGTTGATGTTRGDTIR